MKSKTDKKSTSRSSPRVKLNSARSTPLDFTGLVDKIADIHSHFTHSATKAVNICLTARNWIIGRYIDLYIRKGTDRATYGKNLIGELSKILQSKSIMRTDKRELYRFHAFYCSYPQFGETLSPQFNDLEYDKIVPGQKVETVSPLFQDEAFAARLALSLSFSHFCELIELKEPEKTTPLWNMLWAALTINSLSPVISLNYLIKNN